MRSPHRVRRAARLAVSGLLFASLLSLLLALAGAGPAAAHATLLANDPADGALLAEAPSSVTLTFDEPVQVRTESVQVLDAAGSTVDVTARSVDSTVVVDLPTGLADGTYVVSWRVISADSHPVAGGFSFAIGAPTAGSVAIPVTEPDLALRVLRPVTEALLYVGVLGGTGLAVFGLSFLQIPARRRQLPTVVGLGVVALVAVAVMPPVTTAWQDAADIGALADPTTWRTGYLSDLGLAAALTAVGVLAVMVGARLETSGIGAARRPAGVAMFAGAGLALGALALVGHTRSFGPVWLTLGSDLLHLVTAAVWLGGILGLVHLLSRRLDTTSAVQRAGVVAAFSQTAAFLVALLAVAGVLLGWRIVGSWSALFGTTYGLVLLGKVAAVGVLVCIAGWNRYRLVPRTCRPDAEAAAMRSLRRTVRAEAVLLVGVLAVTGVLVTRDPTDRASDTTATGSADGRTSALEQAVVADSALGDGRVQIRITPGATGINALELALFDAAGQPLEPVAPPTVTVTLPEVGVGPLDRRLARTGPGRYEAVADFPLPGSWEVTVNVRTSRFDSPIATIPVEIR
ncbi:copper resistance protein CopC [Solwaraspora sp. WMMD937]|uniref:copper resistance CopC/CopD family protein n=1 Tax=Solwaraspora sp. WMMD937 TaxID=3016090 RepID=UPI00249A3B41|nr:copper resistance protein CopC [Solwaraspora sp. WMMD937]WFE23967.1 copper resistance protein CopC [Solwaraspora sp. WMMD937]